MARRGRQRYPAPTSATVRSSHVRFSHPGRFGYRLAVQHRVRADDHADDRRRLGPIADRHAPRDSRDATADRETRRHRNLLRQHCARSVSLAGRRRRARSEAVDRGAERLYRKGDGWLCRCQGHRQTRGRTGADLDAAIRSGNRGRHLVLHAPDAAATPGRAGGARLAERQGARAGRSECNGGYAGDHGFLAVARREIRGLRHRRRRQRGNHDPLHRRRHRQDVARCIAARRRRHHAASLGVGCRRQGRHLRAPAVGRTVRSIAIQRRALPPCARQRREQRRTGIRQGPVEGGRVHIARFRRWAARRGAGACGRWCARRGVSAQRQRAMEAGARHRG